MDETLRTTRVHGKANAVSETHRETQRMNLDLRFVEISGSVPGVYKDLYRNVLEKHEFARLQDVMAYGFSRIQNGAV